MLFCSADNVRRWRRLRPLDEVGLCRAFAGWDVARPVLGHWAPGPGLRYADCIQGCSAQFVMDRSDDYRSACRVEEPRALVANEAAYVLTGGLTVCLAIDSAAPGIDPYRALNDVLTWLVYCGLTGDVDTSVLSNGSVERSIIGIDRSQLARHPIAWA